MAGEYFTCLWMRRMTTCVCWRASASCARRGVMRCEVEFPPCPDADLTLTPPLNLKRPRILLRPGWFEVQQSSAWSTLSPRNCTKVAWWLCVRCHLSCTGVMFPNMQPETQPGPRTE